MSGPSQADVRRYFAGLALANDFEVEELRQTPIELKLRQLWVLMTSAHLLDDGQQREAEAAEVRARWARLHQALNA